MIRILFICIVLFFSYSHSFAGKYPESSVGINYNMISGSGINYQLEFDNHNSILFNGFYYYYAKNPPDVASRYVIFGAEYRYSLFSTSQSSYFAFLGSSYWSLEEKYTTTKVINDKKIITKFTDTNPITNLGIGLGYQYLIDNSVYIDFNLGFYNQSSIKSFKTSTFIDRSPNSTNFNGLGVGIGIRILIN